MLGAGWTLAKLAAAPIPIDRPIATKAARAATVAPASRLCTTRPELRRWIRDTATMTVERDERLRRDDERRKRNGQGEDRRPVGGRRHESAGDSRPVATAPAAIPPENPATKAVHPVEEPRARAEGVAQIHMLPPAGARPERRQFGVGHGAREGEDAATGPHAEHHPGGGHQAGDEHRDIEDAPADDVRDDDADRVGTDRVCVSRRRRRRPGRS